MALQLSDAVRNARLDAVESTIGALIISKPEISFFTSSNTGNRSLEF